MRLKPLTLDCYERSEIKILHPLFSALQLTGHTLAGASSVALIWLSQNTLLTCYQNWGTCGTPCATASAELMVAPIVLVLPFAQLFFARELPASGLFARCALTGGAGVWLVTMAALSLKIPVL